MLNFYQDIFLVFSLYSLLYFAASSFYSATLGLQILNNAALVGGAGGGGGVGAGFNRWDFSARVTLISFAACASFGEFRRTRRRNRKKRKMKKKTRGTR
jgi:hypothetical protein